MNIWYDDWYWILCTQYCYMIIYLSYLIFRYMQSQHTFQKMNAVHVVLPKKQSKSFSHIHSAGWQSVWSWWEFVRTPADSSSWILGRSKPRSWVGLSLIDYDLIIAEDPTICSIIHYIHVCSKVDLMPLSLLWSFLSPALTNSSGCRSIFAVKTVDGAKQKYFVYICLWILFDKPINLSYQQTPDFNRWFLLKFASSHLRHFNCSSMG